MIGFICLFFPAFITISKLDSKITLEEKFVKYIIYTIFINIIVLYCVALSNNFEVLYLSRDTFTVVFSIKYLIIASLVALVLPHFWYFVKNNFRFRIRKGK